MQIGKSVKLDDDSVIQYFADGILYQATSVEDLKDKVKIYEKIRRSTPQAPTFKVSSRFRTVR